MANKIKKKKKKEFTHAFFLLLLRKFLLARTVGLLARVE